MNPYPPNMQITIQLRTSARCIPKLSVRPGVRASARFTVRKSNVVEYSKRHSECERRSGVNAALRHRQLADARTSARRSAREAFTLVELLLVLVILGILAAIVVPKFAGRTEQAKQRAAETQISAFSTALGIFETDNGYYPKGKDGLQDLRTQPRDAQNWHGPYMEKDIPLDPWNHPYIHVCPGKHNPSGYDLYSVGPDGREGNEDDITNWQQKK